MDVLAELDHILDRTPPDCYATPPLSRRTVAVAAAEIRRLRILLDGRIVPRDERMAYIAKCPNCGGSTGAASRRSDSDETFALWESECLAHGDLIERVPQSAIGAAEWCHCHDRPQSKES